MKKVQALAAIALACAALTSHAADLVVIGNPAAGPLSKDQVADIFLGKSQAAVPLDQPESTPVRDQFYSKATGRDAGQVKATWSRIAFSGKGEPPKVMPDADAVKKAIAGNAKAVGYVDAGAVDGSVKVLLTLD